MAPLSGFLFPFSMKKAEFPLFFWQDFFYNSHSRANAPDCQAVFLAVLGECRPLLPSYFPHILMKGDPFHEF